MRTQTSIAKAKPLLVKGMTVVSADGVGDGGIVADAEPSSLPLVMAPVDNCWSSDLGLKPNIEAIAAPSPNVGKGPSLNQIRVTPLVKTFPEPIEILVPDIVVSISGWNVIPSSMIAPPGSLFGALVAEGQG